MIYDSIFSLSTAAAAAVFTHIVQNLINEGKHCRTMNDLVVIIGEKKGKSLKVYSFLLVKTFIDFTSNNSSALLFHGKDTIDSAD